MRSNFVLNVICITITSLLSLNSGSAQNNANESSNCNLNLSAVKFRGSEAAIKSSQQEAYLNFASIKIKANPQCRIKVNGYGSKDKTAQQTSWDRVNAVIRYLVEKTGIGKDRFIFQYGLDGGNVNEVELQGTTEEGPNTVPAPHPNLHKDH